MPKNTWRLTVEGEMKIMNNTWETVEKMAKNRQKWRTFVAALHANGISGSFTFFLLFFSGVRDAHSLVFCVVFCIPLFVPFTLAIVSPSFEL
jgi:hypothetical protein